MGRLRYEQNIHLTLFAIIFFELQSAESSLAFEAAVYSWYRKLRFSPRYKQHTFSDQRDSAYVRACFALFVDFDKI